MLRITVEILPGGREEGRRELARALIGNVSMGELSKYRVRVTETGVEGAKIAEIEDYPRFSASLWDLVIETSGGTDRRV